MKHPAHDWNEAWRKGQIEMHDQMHDPAFWDKQAPGFTHHATKNDYIPQALKIMKTEPGWSVLDIGCATGTLAIPLAPRVQTITALDPSPVMLSLLETHCQERGIDNVTPVQGGWEDDWDALNVGRHDVVIASRSLIVDDLRGAIVKLQHHARKRVYISAQVGDGARDRAIIEATGQEVYPGADYIVICNLLREMGIFADITFTCHVEDKCFTDVEEALNSVRWMVHNMSEEEEQRLRRHLEQTLIGEKGRWKLPHREPLRWAILGWEIRP